MNLDLTEKRFAAWWNNALLDRPPVTFNWVGKNNAPVPELDFQMDRYLVDAELRLSLFEQMLPLRVFPGDSFPLFSAGISADHNGTIFGLELGCSKASVWSKHFLENARDALSLTANLDNPYWKSIREATDLSLERSRGRWVTALCCHGGMSGDILVALRGPEGLCMDAVDDPEGVRLAANHISSFYPLVYNDIYNRLAAAGSPISAENELSRRRTGRIGCDFLCMISAEMGRDTVYEAIEADINCLQGIWLEGNGSR